MGGEWVCRTPVPSEVLSFQVETKPGCNKENGLHGTLKTSWNKIGIYLDLAQEAKKAINPWICHTGRRICSVWYCLCALCSSAWKFSRKYSQRQVSGYLSAWCVTHGNCTRTYFRCCPDRAESLKEILVSMMQCHMSDTHIHKFNIKCWALILLIGKTAMKTSCWKYQLLGESRSQDAAWGTGHFFGPFPLQSSTKEGLCNPESSGNESQGFPLFQGSYAHIIIMPQRPIQMSA